MSDLIDEPAPGRNLPEYTVSEISGAVKRTLEGEFGRVRVRGEVGRVFRARSGHLYFDVKDERNVLACTTWRGQVGALSVEPEEGLEVVVTGRLTAFGGQSKYNLNVDEVAVAGQGALMALLEKRRQALAAEGLFDAARKRPLPFLPGVIGVVTSPSGAVIRDILHRLRDRFPRRVLVWPAAVQGAACAAEVARAIRGFNALTPGGALPRPDLIIVARGGGSIEDLWGFNEEIVVRAAAESAIPLISAVGHETDTTLIDYAADRRAPTPSAAAELAVPVRLDLLSAIEAQEARIRLCLRNALGHRRQRLGDLARGLPRREALLDGPRQRLDILSERLPRALIRAVERRRLRLFELSGSLRPAVLSARIAHRRARLDDLGGRLSPALGRSLCRRREAWDRLSGRLVPRPLTERIARQRERLAGIELRLARDRAARLASLHARIESHGRLLATLGYEATLRRGYAVVRREGRPVTTLAAAKGARRLELQFADGRLEVAPDQGPAAAVAPKKPPPDQGSLF
ncbi:exodeoxyribonuclease VII large subunit [Pontibaca methylaminivorans]|uniref:exodeoxyribonuclease VII large subunit n=1 Tax=Pontibaca methylaminivorans TaxID=515897 RepID=UPI002FD87F47